MEESLMDIMPRLEKRTHYIATFANLATLLGLLGTVIGLINAFAAVATVNPAEKANLLSASISVAMNCTAFGLMTAVPLLLIHAVLQTKTTDTDRQPGDGVGEVPQCRDRAAGAAGGWPDARAAVATSRMRRRSYQRPQAACVTSASRPSCCWCR